MKATAKMVKVRFNDVTLSVLLEYNNPELVKLYEEHSSFKKRSEIYDWNFSWHKTEYKGLTSEERKALFADDEKFDEVVKKYPEYKSFELIISLEKYSEYIYDFNNTVSFSIIEKFEIDYNQKIINSKDNFDSALEMINKNIELFEKQMAGLKDIGEQHYNLKCNTVVPDSFLTKVNQIKLLEDACSDYLQECLKDGWRILAITPQPNQRRPDYILGKHVENPDGVAAR